MKKAVITALAAAGLLAGCSEKQPLAAGRLVLPRGEFSFVTPAGWCQTKLPGVDFVIVSTGADAGIKPNIYIDGILPGAPLDDAAAALTEKSQRSLRSYTSKQQSDFPTSSGLHGIKISATHKTKEELTLAIFQYLIQDSNRIISITCTCADSEQSSCEPVFDAAMKSLESETPI